MMLQALSINPVMNTNPYVDRQVSAGNLGADKSPPRWRRSPVGAEGYIIRESTGKVFPQLLSTLRDGAFLEKTS